MSDLDQRVDKANEEYIVAIRLHDSTAMGHGHLVAGMEMREARERYEALVVQRATQPYRELLQHCEWRAVDSDGYYCVSCYVPREETHAPDCRLAKLLEDK